VTYGGRAFGAVLAALLMVAVVATSALRVARVEAQPARRGATLEALRLVPRVLHRQSVRGRSFRLLRWRVPLDRMALDLTEIDRRETMADALRRTRGTLAVNGAFFDERGATMGLAVAGGEVRGEVSPVIGGGVMVVRNGRASLHWSEGFSLPEGVEFAVQAKPVLVMGGQIVRLRRGVQPADRTALCIRDGGRTVDVYVARSTHPRARGGPTLRAFARALLDAGCDDALNLDGGRSTGAAWREGSRTVVLAARAVIHQLVIVRPR
jgi:hypothetical protein